MTPKITSDNLGKRQVFAFSETQHTQCVTVT